MELAKLAAGIFLCLLYARVESAEHGFCYEKEECGPRAWAGQCASGKKQSPIDVPNLHINEIDRPVGFLYLSKGYSEPQSFFLKNNGHTAQASIRPDLTSTITAAGTLLGATYTFSQAHFHWGPDDSAGSEHTNAGTSYPAEVHLVHYRSDFSSLQSAIGSNQTGAVTVLAALYHVSQSDNPELEPIVKLLEGIREADSQANGDGLVISKLLPVNTYQSTLTAQYDGSLTTPNCDEVVLWNVFLSPVPISPRQLEAFRSLKSSDGSLLRSNARPTQDLRGRELRFYETKVRRETHTEALED